jgi:hypothetical protein
VLDYLIKHDRVKCVVRVFKFICTCVVQAVLNISLGNLKGAEGWGGGSIDPYDLPTKAKGDPSYQAVVCSYIE